jgi:hypothetical protein
MPRRPIQSEHRRIHAELTDSLSAVHRASLDNLLKSREDSKTTLLAWLRQSPAEPDSRHKL